jgi:acetyl esterase
LPLDAQVKELLDWLETQNLPATNQVPPAEARRLFRLRLQRMDTPGEPVASIEDRRIPGPEGEIPLRIYTPAGRGPFPALVYFHGGGWIVGDLDTHQSGCCFLTNSVPCVVVAVDYRLAPEHKFPTATEDCYAAVRWVVDNARTVNVDPNRIAIGGDSSGGNLAAAVGLMSRDRGGPALVFQLLIYPVIDFNFGTPSYQENGTGYLLTKELMVHYWQQYLRNEADSNNPYASPVRAENLKGLPPAFILTAQYDPLRDEGQAYAQRLRDAGVPALVHNYDGLIHGFWSMGSFLEQTQSIRQEVSQVLRSAFVERGATVR